MRLSRVVSLHSARASNLQYATSCTMSSSQSSPFWGLNSGLLRSCGHPVAMFCMEGKMPKLKRCNKHMEIQTCEWHRDTHPEMSGSLPGSCLLTRIRRGTANPFEDMVDLREPHTQRAHDPLCSRNFKRTELQNTRRIQ